MEEYESCNGIFLKKNEKIEYTSKPTVRGLIITWAVIPTILLINFCVFYLPSILRYLFVKAAREAILSSVDLENEVFNIFSYTTESVFGTLPGFISGLIKFVVGLLIIAWLGWCLVMTYRHFRYSFAITNFRVIGKSGNEKIDTPLDGIVNVFIEQSIIGRLLNYGCIVVATQKKSLSFYNIANPSKAYTMLMDYAQNYCAH